MAYVYKHIRLDKNEVFYIGIAKSTRKRRSIETRGRNLYWTRITNKTEWEVEIVEDGLTWDEACKLETELIKKYGRKDLNEGSLVNMTDGGDGMWNVSEEVKLKFSEMYSGEGNPMYGRNHTDYTKQKISKSKQGQLLGVPKPDGFGKKVSESLMGREFSKEHKDNLSKSNLNRDVLTCPHCGKSSTHNMKRYHFDNCKSKNPEIDRDYKVGNWRGHIKVTDERGDETIYESASHVSRELGADLGSVLAHSKNGSKFKRGKFKNWKFELLKSYNDKKEE